MNQSIINKRIASALVRRRLDVDDRIDILLTKIEQQYNATSKEIAELVTSDRLDIQKFADFQKLIFSGMANTQIVMSQELKKSVQIFHDWAVWAWAESLPEGWLLSRVPPEVIADFESVNEPTVKRFLNFDAGTLQVSDSAKLDGMYSVPIPVQEVAFGVPKELKRRKLTATDKQEIFHKILFPPPSIEEVESIVDESTWVPRLQKWSRQVSDNRAAFTQITQGFADGENISQIRKRIIPLVAGVRSAAQRIARTEASRIAEQVQRKTWEPLGDMLMGAQVLAVLDENTRPHHASRNGRVYYSSPPAGKPSMAELPDLPDEPNCRCMASPVLKPPKTIEKDIRLNQKFEEDSVGITDAVSAEKWFETADARKRKKVVGSERYRFVQELFQELRQPEYSDFLNSKGELMSLSELRKETSIDRAIRKESVKKMIREQELAFLEVSSRGFLN